MPAASAAPDGSFSHSQVTDLEGRLESVLDSIADGVTVLDRTGRIRFANATAAQLLGRASATELIGASGSELLAEYVILDAAGRELDPGRMPTRRALAGEPDAEETVRFRRRGSLDDQWSLVRARVLPGSRP
jgi:PAS domain S-box-containing protein